MDGGLDAGASHMAVDAAVLDNPSRFRVPTVRLYRWRPACISLGTHQREDAVDLSACRRDGVDVVRRPTGGRAVLHADEATYSIVVPGESEWGGLPKQELYRRVSESIVAGLTRLGLPVSYEKRTLRPPSPMDATASASCFGSAARWEILLDGRKLVGSAQKIGPSALLQHGSILTGEGHRRLSRYLSGRPAPADPSISIEAYTGSAVRFEDVSESVRTGFESVFTVRFDRTKLTEEEEKLAVSLRPLAAISGTGAAA
jgi:lipoyl(octanoyl) transferase